MTANAPRWHDAAPGLWRREPVAGGATCVLRARRGGGYEMSVNGGAWRYAGPELRRAQEHAGGHACGFDDPRVLDVTTCGECSRLAKTEEAGR